MSTRTWEMAQRYYGRDVISDAAQGHPVPDAEQGEPIPDYTFTHAHGISEYDPFQKIPNAYDLNRAYNEQDTTTQYPPSLSSNQQPTPQESFPPEQQTSKPAKMPFKIIAAVIIVAVLVFVAFCLALVFGIPPSLDQGNEEPETAADFKGRVIVENIQWDSDMADRNSDTFKLTASVIQLSMDTYYSKSAIAEIYSHSLVTGLWQGSVGSDVEIYLKTLTEEISPEMAHVYNEIRAGRGVQILADNLEQGKENFVSEQAQKAPEDRIVLNTFRTSSFEGTVAATSTAMAETTTETTTVKISGGETTGTTVNGETTVTILDTIETTAGDEVTITAYETTETTVGDEIITTVSETAGATISDVVFTTTVGETSEATVSDVAMTTTIGETTEATVSDVAMTITTAGTAGATVDDVALETTRTTVGEEILTTGTTGETAGATISEEEVEGIDTTAGNILTTAS